MLIVRKPSAPLLNGKAAAYGSLLSQGRHKKIASRSSDLPVGQKPVQPHLQKYSCFVPTQITSLISPSRPTRGAYRDRHGRWVRDAVDAAASGAHVARGRMMLLRTVKSCGPDTPTLVSSWRSNLPMTVAKEPGHRGEHEISRKTIACGNAGLFR